MSGKQTAVLWMGILLITAQFYFGGQFQALFGIIKSTPAPNRRSGGSKNQTNPNAPSSGMGTKGGINVPGYGPPPYVPPVMP